MTLFAIRGQHTRDLLTYQGRPIVHTNRREMEWLMPGAHVVEVTEQDLARRSPLAPIRLPDHPSLAGISWPLRPEEFRTGSRGGLGPPSGRMRIWSSIVPDT